MTDLTDFLLARIAEDEAAAERAVIWRTRNGMAWIGPTPETATVLAMSGHRLFAQCVAHRGIVERAVLDVEDTLYPIMKLLALPYADHPDYQREWTRS